MWSFVSNAIARKKNSNEPSTACLGFSDDEICSDASTEEGLECPICWESFNIVENVPYVLWCGHTLCKNCVLGLQCAALRFYAQRVQIPFFISCPWCHLLTLRMVYEGNLKFPRKNFFLLWMIENLNGDRMKPHSSICGDHQPVWSPRNTSALRNHSSSTNHRRVHRLGHWGSINNDHDSISNNHTLERPHLSLHKSLHLFLQFTAKFPMIILFLLIFIFAILSSVAILALYLLITVLVALPAFLVLYFAYPFLKWLAREITT
ncbi:unnamed protein product [Ilex paraguariensis]|uniref:RING-type domain-containing protein n=1 Tax=Ilex paraguariensis TaxID=185542 RepID=A0ABC8T8K1_9AQUA